MSTGNVNLDILMKQIREDAESGSYDAIKAMKKRYPSLSEKELMEIHSMIIDSVKHQESDEVSLVATTPPSFSIKTKTTKVVVDEMLENAKDSILITGYSLSDYFNNQLDCIIKKSQEGVFVKFFVNNIDEQENFTKLCRYKGRFLRIYNYSKQEDSMSALHAKVISVDKKETLITSANLSYHGQEGNIELGTYVSSAEIGEQVDELFSQLIYRKILTAV